MAKELNELQKKLKELRLSLGYNSQEAFAKALGMTQATIANMETGARDVSKNVVYAIKEKLNIDLLSWNGYKPPHDLGLVVNNCIGVPFYKIAASAGAGNYLRDSDPEEDVLYFDERWLKNILGVNPANLHLIFADGDSMDSGFGTKEDIKDKDLLMVDKSQLTGNGKIFVIQVNNSELRVKKLFKKLDGTLIISSNNPKYKDEEYIPGNSDIEIKVIGRVVWNGSKENV